MLEQSSVFDQPSKIMNLSEHNSLSQNQQNYHSLQMSNWETNVINVGARMPTKTKFYTKYKLRSSKKEKPLSSRINAKHPDKNQRAKTELSESAKQVIVNPKSQIDKFKAINLNHNSSSCLCNECDCGRHLCNLHSERRRLRSSTVYQDEYRKKKPIRNIVNISTEYDPLAGPNLELKSVYLQDYSAKSGQLESAKPNNNLKTEGPFMGLTSYSSGFPGHRGDNQYVKPTDSHLRGYFPMRCRTTYSDSYTGASFPKNRVERALDNLKTGYSWMGSSSYAQSYSRPNPQYLVSTHKEVQRADVVPAYSEHQTATIYKNSYSKHEIGVCPAKKVIAGWGKERVNLHKSKLKFKENSDFRGMDSTFRPLSAVK